MGEIKSREDLLKEYKEWGEWLKSPETRRGWGSEAMKFSPNAPFVYPSGLELPCIELTAPTVFDDEGYCIERVMKGTYPGYKKHLSDCLRAGLHEEILGCSATVDDMEVCDPDPGGGIALDWGGRFYDEGMECVNSGDAVRRVSCFSAAEILYLHSRERGNPFASLCLGYVYSYDRCEGRYFSHWYRPLEATEQTVAETGKCSDMFTSGIFMLGSVFQSLTKETWRTRPLRENGTGRELSPEEVDVWRKEQAAICYKEAADAGIPEAMYKYGDCLQWGTGVERDAEEAFCWYRKALRYIDCERASVAGSIAFRLAKCYEEGIGCKASIPDSCEAYGLAVEQLEDAVENGDWYYQKVLARARKGLARTTQLLSFAQEEEFSCVASSDHIARIR